MILTFFNQDAAYDLQMLQRTCLIIYELRRPLKFTEDVESFCY